MDVQTASRIREGKHPLLPPHVPAKTPSQPKKPQNPKTRSPRATPSSPLKLEVLVPRLLPRPLPLPLLPAPLLLERVAEGAELVPLREVLALDLLPQALLLLLLVLRVGVVVLGLVVEIRA